jgi:hypothetical protein
MIPPIAIPSAGSGGGGGGDHLTNPVYYSGPGAPPPPPPPPPASPANDDQGGGGGGGGGGVRISCVGAYTQGTPSAVGSILSRGATGASGAAGQLAGAGGSGSGGEIWIQSFATVTIHPTAVMDVTGPPRLNPMVGTIGCSNQASGGGGAGLIQIEAGLGPPATPSFNILPSPTPTSGAVFSAPPFVFAGGVFAQARSVFRYAGPAPDYTGAVETSSIGNSPNAAILIRYEGAFEAIDSTPLNPVPDLATIKSAASGGGPITAATLDELDGYPLIRFVVTTVYAAPPLTPPGAILPSVDRIIINLNGTPGCP